MWVLFFLALVVEMYRPLMCKKVQVRVAGLVRMKVKAVESRTYGARNIGDPVVVLCSQCTVNSAQHRAGSLRGFIIGRGPVDAVAACISPEPVRLSARIGLLNFVVKLHRFIQ